MENLFVQSSDEFKPLAFKLRPRSLDELIGQESLLGKGSLLRTLIEENKLSNMLLHGPSGCGKSSVGELISKSLNYKFFSLNATTASLNDLKEIAKKSRSSLELDGRPCVLFLDEIHRFNKLQQDALLSYSEDGTFILIGATTENPYFSLNNALLSRLLIFEFKPLSDTNIATIINRACEKIKLYMDEDTKKLIIKISAGDARVAINYTKLYQDSSGLNEDAIKEQFASRKAGYDGKEDKYKLISAFIKSMRGSHIDSALYWMGRMLKGGEDPRFIARRMMVFASEDIGLANSNALLMASSAMQAANEIGMPEVRIILAQVCIFLASCVKSNSSYKAINKVFHAIDEGDLAPVPFHLRPNSKKYLYPHAYKNHFIKQNYGKQRFSFYEAGENKAEEKLNKNNSFLWEGE